MRVMHISIVVTFFNFIIGLNFMNFIINETRMWANAQRDVTLPNMGGALCSTTQSLADAHYLTAVQ